MRIGKAASARTLSMAGKDIRLALKEYYGSPEEAEKAIRERMEDEDAMESWATLVTEYHPLDEPQGIFRFSDVPTPLREEAKASMAAAMLAWEAQQQRSALRAV